MNDGRAGVQFILTVTHLTTYVIVAAITVDDDGGMLTS